ncbi:hypothetical protein CPB84DRAFT_1747145 [Gymnopilus junonius]|uniref:Uncharacterized protein n=1 Tax=Gymnopilus junonius TaxID=109634 RepID=A0A9P5NNC8_GYMJU|nr:hypothetical protein CPB84DRAFT_1747145 [Gymnopilus junonius]
MGRDVKDMSTRHEGSIMERGRTGTCMSSHTRGKKRVGWIEQSESEELGGYSEPEGGGGKETSGSVEVIAVQGKEKAKASHAKAQATIHLTKYQVIAKQKEKKKVVNMQQEEEEEEDNDNDNEGPVRHWNLNNNADEIVD